MTDKKFRLAVLISGGGSNLQSIIDHIDRGAVDAEIAIVISNCADAGGLRRAESAGVKTEILDSKAFTSLENYNLALADRVSACRPDLVVLAGYMKILPENFVNRFKGRIVNIHPSLLPKHKGLDTHRRAIACGDKVHGATVHFVTADLDAGPIIIQKEVKICKNDTAKTLQRKVLAEEHKIYPRAIQWLAAKQIDFNNPRPAR